MDPLATATAFVTDYCSIFDTNRAGLEAFYTTNSTLTLEGNEIKGSANIVAKLTNLPFRHFRHKISSVNCSPAAPGTGGVFALVCGEFLIADESLALNFTQVFNLMPKGRGSLYVLNHVFRLHYA